MELKIKRLDEKKLFKWFTLAFLSFFLGVTIAFIFEDFRFVFIIGVLVIVLSAVALALLVLYSMFIMFSAPQTGRWMRTDKLNPILVLIVIIIFLAILKPTPGNVGFIVGVIFAYLSIKWLVKKD